MHELHDQRRQLQTQPRADYVGNHLPHVQLLRKHWDGRCRGISGADELYGGYWNGSVSYETATACVARPFSDRQTIYFSNDTLCVVSIEY
ncbi:hypothetical protein GCM10010404_75600 [Nonomuraea africana]